MSELLLVYEDGRAEWIPNNYEAIRAGIDHWIDLAGGHGELSAFVDDEGILRGRPLNVVASIALGRPIFGPAVLCAPEGDEEGNTLPPDEQAARAMEGLALIWRNVLEQATQIGQDLTVIARPETLPPPQVYELDEEQFQRWMETGEVPE